MENSTVVHSVVMLTLLMEYCDCKMVQFVVVAEVGSLDLAVVCVYTCVYVCVCTCVCICVCVCVCVRVCV